MRPVSSSSEAQCTISEEAHMRGKVESEYGREGEGGQRGRETQEIYGETVP